MADPLPIRGLEHVPTMTDLSNLALEAERLAPLPASTLRLADLLGGDDWDLDEVVEILQLDPGLTVELLELANCALAAPGTPVLDTATAVMRLGPGLVLALVIGVTTRPVMQATGPEGIDLWEHSLATALAAEPLRACSRAWQQPEVFPAALLHDMGRVIMAGHDGDLGELDPERDHAELGALVAEGWGLPPTICNLIRYHHDTASVSDPDLRTQCEFVSLADRAARAARSEEDPNEYFDAELGEHLGLSDKSWESLVEVVRTRLEGVLSTYS